MLQLVVHQHLQAGVCAVGIAVEALAIFLHCAGCRPCAWRCAGAQEVAQVQCVVAVAVDVNGVFAARVCGCGQNVGCVQGEGDDGVGGCQGSCRVRVLI